MHPPSAMIGTDFEPPDHAASPSGHVFLTGTRWRSAAPERVVTDVRAVGALVSAARTGSRAMVGTALRPFLTRKRIRVLAARRSDRGPRSAPRNERGIVADQTSEQAAHARIR